MKKLTLVLLTSLLTTTGCSPSKKDHEHSFSNEWTFNEEEHYHESTCGHDVVSEQGFHTFSSWEVTRLASSEQKGLKARHCTVCPYSEEKEYDYIPELPIIPLDFPIFSIDTENGASIVSKEEYVAGDLDIYNADGFNDKDLSLGIRGRGNYSWSGTEKKSFRIKFDKKYQPLGQGNGACKSWTLLAVHCDKSLLRTDGAFHFANQLNNIPFVSSSSFVDLVLNGEYLGVYELCDQIQVNKYRVDIDDSGEEDDIGYLVELDKNASENVVRLNSGLTFEVKSDGVLDNQMAFITDYLNQCETAIKSGNQETIASLIDIPSAVDAYLVEEIFKNLDVGWGSFYYTKPAGDKLYFGPVWDFDLSAGNANSDYNESSFTSYKYTYVGNSTYSRYSQQHTWYLSLRKNAWFNDMIKERFFEIKEAALETVSYIRHKADFTHDSFERNFVVWDIFDEKINREPSAIMKIKSFIGQVDYLVDWLSQRVDWLNEFYLGNVKDK